MVLNFIFILNSIYQNPTLAYNLNLTLVFVFIPGFFLFYFKKNKFLLLLYPKHVITLSEYTLACYTLNTHLSLSDDNAIVAELMTRPNLLNQVQEAQKNDEKISVIVCQNRMGKETEFSVNGDGFLYYRDRVCVPNDSELKKSILNEAHNGSFTIHPGSMKMYQDLKTSYWWSRMKKYVSGFVTKCMVCQRVKAKHQVLSGLLQPIRIPEWK